MVKAVLIIILFAAAAARPYIYDPNDFAVEVINYTQGQNIGYDLIDGNDFNNPLTALGRPTYMTTGDGAHEGGGYIDLVAQVRVSPVYGAFRAFEIVTVGDGGELILKFNHPVADDEHNLYGIDFIVFGNSFQSIKLGGYWEPNSNPENMIIGGTTLSSEAGVVSVSQDGIIWYTFNSPFADTFAPTAGYAWDMVNHVWGNELDPTQPVDPSITTGSMRNLNVAQAINLYKGAAGGTGFNIGSLGLDWIQYVRIRDAVSNDGITTEVDAISDVSARGDYKHPLGDINLDCRVDFIDFSKAAKDQQDTMDVINTWMESCGCL